MDDRSGETFIPNTLARIDQIGLPDEERAAVLTGTPSGSSLAGSLDRQFHLGRSRRVVTIDNRSCVYAR
jgi:hypothetical protein